MAVIPSYQKQGIGKKLFNFTLEKLNSFVSGGIGLLMEIQRENVQDLQEAVLRKNRMKFYMSLRAKILDGVDYLLPPLQHGITPEVMHQLGPFFSDFFFQFELSLKGFCFYCSFLTIFKILVWMDKSACI